MSQPTSPSPASFPPHNLVTTTIPDNYNPYANQTDKQDQKQHQQQPSPTTSRAISTTNEGNKMLKTIKNQFRWISDPSAALPLILLPPSLYLLQVALLPMIQDYLPPHSITLGGPKGWTWTGVDVCSWVFMIAHPKADGYIRGYKDIAFVCYYIIVFSFIRQTLVLHVLPPLAKKLKVKKNKTDRFVEQGYGFLYWGTMAVFGIFVMKELPTWQDGRIQTSAFFNTFPATIMTPRLKTFYLLQMAFWLQQLLLLLVGSEKPRSDFREFVAHHAVTIHLIYWSYNLCFTYIGVLVFITMDLSDTFLCLAKSVNYFNEKISIWLFSWFIIVWTYARHYLNIRMIWSLATEFKLIPEGSTVRLFPWSQDVPVHWWMQSQIMLAMVILQGLNLFWYFLILRVFYRALIKNETVKDDRSDCGDNDEEREEMLKAEILAEKTPDPTVIAQ